MQEEMLDFIKNKVNDQSYLLRSTEYLHLSVSASHRDYHINVSRGSFRLEALEARNGRLRQHQVLTGIIDRGRRYLLH